MDFLSTIAVLVLWAFAIFCAVRTGLYAEGIRPFDVFALIGIFIWIAIIVLLITGSWELLSQINLK